MATLAESVSIRDVYPVHLMGTRQTNRPATRAQTQVKVGIESIEEHPNAAIVSAEVEVRELSEDGAAVKDQDPLYTGAAAYVVQLQDQSFGEAMAPEIVHRVWPYLRSELLGHAGRLGMPLIRLPLLVDAEHPGAAPPSPS